MLFLLTGTVGTDIIPHGRMGKDRAGVLRVLRVEQNPLATTSPGERKEER
jgi:hypothetical protein